MIEPRLPRDISPLARACLDGLAADGVGRHISLGGASGLAHYHEYRQTHDVDARWRDPVSRDQERAVVRSLVHALEHFGTVRVREWGDVVSAELAQGGKTTFSFQVARRSAQVASKMVALVERGAPRDLRDIHSICMAGLCSPRQCWELWETRQREARAGAAGSRARAAIATHLARLAVARPLDRIQDPAQRQSAEALRPWFEKEFLA